MPSVNNEVFLTIPQAREILPMSAAWYAKARCERNGPSFVKIGQRVFYPKSSLIAFAEAHTVKPAAESALSAPQVVA